MRVLLADDQKQVCAALRMLLSQQPGLSIVGQTGDARDLLAQIQQTKPDLVLLDWGLPDLPVIGSLPALRLNHSRLLIIALSSRPEAAQEVLAAGADAFVSKVDPPERLLAALRAMQARNGT